MSLGALTGWASASQPAAPIVRFPSPSTFGSWCTPPSCCDQSLQPLNLPAGPLHHKMALPACAYGGRKTSYLHDTHQTTSQLTVPSSEVEIEVALHCGAAQHAWQWWEGTGFCHGRCEEFWQSPRVERGSAGEKEAVRKTRRSCKLGGREGCCWSTSDGSPWRSAACWALSSGRGENSGGCVQQENWKNWNRGMYSEGSCCLKRQKMLQHIAHYCV